MSEALNDAALKQLFFDARTFNKFQSRPIDDTTLHTLVDLMKWGPTSMNAQPGRWSAARRASSGSPSSSSIARNGTPPSSPTW